MTATDHVALGTRVRGRDVAGSLAAARKPGGLVGVIVLAGCAADAAGRRIAEDPGVSAGASNVEVLPWHR